MNLIKPLTLSLALATPLHAEIDIQPVISPQGITGWLVEERSIPFVAIEVIFPGGANLDPDSAEGAVSLMSALLSEGAGDLDAQGYAAALESLAGSVSFSAGRDSVSLSIQALSENRDQVIDLARLALMEPRFDAVSLARVQAQQIASLERAARNPNTIASRAFNELAYEGHPYARPTDGTPETVAGLTHEAITAAHRSALTRDRVLVGAAGDISARELGEIMDRLLADLPQATTPLPEYAAFTAPAGVTVIPHAGPQSVVAFGHAGIPRDDNDFMAAFVMNEIFGGGRFGTRLMSELREIRGLTYGVGTSLASASHGDSFQGRLSTANDRVAEVVELIREEWRWLAGGGITSDDLERIKTYLTGAYPLRFDGNGAIASILASMQFQGFDIAYVNHRNDLVRAITLADIERVAARLIRPEALHFVIVGQPDGME
ncbi:MAG TPA: insulinase family protein [Paracoccus sp.]|nr:insulinase family protein [Paracoccus sp. (in: a-proteobacteria)]